jgi:NAD(P)-dependent dehydrogenase (short-subunit alcohol dehydrogenase family)
MDLSTSTALVTGANRGLGRALAAELLSRGAQGDAMVSVASWAPASSSSTRTPEGSESREAITHPAVPAPTTT